jgi:hypothetical protein
MHVVLVYPYYLKYTHLKPFSLKGEWSMGKYCTQLNAELMAIDPATFRATSVPECFMTQESLELKLIAEKHKEFLVVKNLDWSLVDSLDIKAFALQEANTAYLMAVFGTDKLAKAWEKLYTEAVMLREQVLHDYYYAFDGHDNLIELVRKIKENDSFADLVQDMSDIEGAGEQNRELLAASGFDFSQLERAGQLKIELAEMLAKINVEKMEKSPEKDMRDRTYTCLDMAVSKIRACGRSVFWKNQDRARHYASAYLRKMNRKYEKTKKAAGKTVEAVTVA